jgi:hypothetical protein
VACDTSAVPKKLIFVAALLVVLAGLSLPAMQIAWMGHGMVHEVYYLHMLYALLAFLPLSLLSGLGLLSRRRWAWWTGLTSFGLLAAMALYSVGQSNGGPMLAVLFSICAAPGAFLLRPGRVYFDVLR